MNADSGQGAEMFRGLHADVTERLLKVSCEVMTSLGAGSRFSGGPDQFRRLVFENRNKNVRMNRSSFAVES